MARAEKGSELFVLAQFAINSSDPFCAPILGRAADLDPKTGGRGGLQDRWKRREVNRVKRSLHRASHTLVVVARLAIDLTEAVAAEAGVFAETEATNTAAEQVLSVEVPAGRTALRFRPLMRAGGHVTIPNDVDRYRYQIEVEQNGHRTVIWREDIPPFLALGGRQWWDDRLISTADFAAQKVTFHLTAAPRNGHSHPRLHVGFDHVALLTLAPLR